MIDPLHSTVRHSPLSLSGNAEEKDISNTDLEKRLRRQRTATIGTLATGIAHDLNNALGVIIGHAELMTVSGEPLSETLKNHLEGILQAANRSRDLTRRILSFEHGRETPFQPVDLREIIDEALGFLSASLPSTVHIQQSGNPGPHTVLGDPTQLHQMIMNLCINAVQAMDRGKGRIRIGLDRVGLNCRHAQPGGNPSHVRLCVQDTGCGVPAELRESIFDPYFTTKDEGKGTGLGLAVVRDIVERHGGDIRVESEPDQGTVFRITLPLLESVSPRAPSVRESDIPKGTGRILLVEDEGLLCTVGQEILQHLGYEVVTATSAEEALDLFRTSPQHVDLLFTDLTMPGMTGLELVEEIRRIRPNLPVILCSGYASLISDEELHRFGVRELITKPYSARHLARAVHRLLG